MTRVCVRCEGKKVIVIGEDLMDCPVCRGSGEGTVYSAPIYASHVAGSERPDGITADGIRGRI